MESEHEANHLHSPSPWSISGKSSSAAKGSSDRIKSTSNFARGLFEIVRFLLKLPEQTGKCQSPESAKLQRRILCPYYRPTPECQVKD